MWELTDVICLVLLCPMAGMDFKRKRVTVLSLMVLAAGSVVQQWSSHQSDIWLILGGLGIGLVFVILSKVTEEGFGYGDSLGILILSIGLGAWKLIEVLTATFLLLLIGSMIIWCIRKKKNQLIPFYPFLAAGYFLTFLTGMS